MSEQTLDLVQVIRQRLQAAIRRITLADLLFGLVLTLGTIAAIWLIAVAVEAGFWLDATPRAVIFWIFIAVAVGLTGYFLVLPLLRLTGVLRGPSEESVAERIGVRYPEVSDRLVNMLDLVDGRSSTAPSPMLDGAVRMLGEQVRPVPFEQVEDFQRAKKASRLASLPLVGLLLFLIAAPTTFLDASNRLFSPGEIFQRPAPFSLTVEPGSVDLVKGASLDITVRALGTNLPQVLTLAYNNLDEDLVEEVRILADSTGDFHHSFPNVRKSMRYRVSAAPVQTAWFEAIVTERPIVRSLQVNLNFPNYTSIPPQRLVPNVGDVTALPGTRVSVEVGIGGRNVDEALVVFDDGTADSLTVEGDRATGSFTMRREGTYQVVLRNDAGIENSEPITYTLKLLSDAFPNIVLLEPEPLAELDDRMAARLRMRINDDFGFARLRLHYRLAESRFGEVTPTFNALDLGLETPRQLDQEITYDWLLTATGLDPVPGDVIEYFVQVWDNDAFAGYKPAKSATQRLRMASLSEKYEQLEAEQETAESEMEDLLNETDRIRDEFQELRDELRQKQEGDWEDKRQIERLQEKQKQLEERVDEVASQIESMTQQMEENNLVDQETLDMYEELQRVAEEVNSPELQEALKQLQQAMEQLNMQQMQESIQKFEFSEQQYQQRLERTLELFKKLQVEQKLDEAARRAEELAKQEERLAEETQKLMDEEQGEGEREKGEEGEEEEGEKQDGEQKEGEQKEGEQEGENKEGEQKEQQEGENKEGENKEGEQQEGDQQEGEQQEGEQQEGEQQDGEKKNGQQQDKEKKAEQLAKEQERASEEMKELEKQMEELLEKMKDTKNSPQEQMEQLNEQTQQQQMPQKMQENADQMRQQEMQDAQQGQQQMQQQLQQMQQQLQSMQQGQQGQQKMLNMAGIRQALSDILTLSQQQEDLRIGVSASPVDSPRLREFAQTQVTLADGLHVVSDSLQSLAKEIPEMTREVQQQAGDALRAMGNATTALAERSNRQASGEQKTSMMHLNELALLLSDLLDQMANGSGGGSGSMSMQQMLQQLQDMAGQQQQLNQQIQQMLNDMQGNRLSQSQQERLGQMAAQQEAMRKQLQEMGKNKELGNKALGDLNRIAEQMEESIREMQSQQVDRRTVQRQQQILTRLLEASKSMQERGKDNKRESQRADDLTRESPSELTPSEQADELRRALLRALESGYAPDYEELIKRYFELLQQQN